MDKNVILLAICLLSGCSALTSGPDVERSLRDCLVHGGSAIYVVSGDSKRFECKRG